MKWFVIFPALIGLWSADARAATTEADVPYVVGGAHKQQLSLHVPEAKGFPTVLFIHGGSLVSGDRDEPRYVALCDKFQSVGIGCARMSYRLAPGAKWPAMPQDAASAVAWLQANIAARGGDPRKVFVMGHSSGCFLASIVAGDSRYLEFHKLSSADIAGVIPIGCTTDPWNLQVAGVTRERAQQAFDADAEEQAVYPTLEDRLQANPTRYISGKYPRTLFLLGDAERFMPPVLEENARFVRLLLESGVEGDVRVIEKRTHEMLITRMLEPDDPAFGFAAQFIRGEYPRVPR